MRLAASLMILGMGLALAPAPARAWMLQDLAGRTLNQADFHGRWVLVNFWAPWCPPCRQEVPELVRLGHDAPDGLAVIGIAVSYRDPKAVTDFVRRHRMDYPVVLGSTAMAAEFGGLRGLPTSFLYGPSGRLVHRFEGPQTEAAVEQVMVAPR